MSNKITDGTALAGRFQSKLPGGMIQAPAYRFSLASTTAVDTGFVFNTNQILSDVYIRVTSVAATSATMSVGIMTPSSSNIASAFLSSVAIGTTGTYQGTVTVSTSAGAQYEYYVSTTYGAYLATLNAGGTSGNGTGTFEKFNHIIGKSTTGAVAYRNLSVTSETTAAVAGFVTPIFFELGS